MGILLHTRRILGARKQPWMEPKKVADNLSKLLQTNSFAYVEHDGEPEEVAQPPADFLGFRIHAQ